MLCFLSKMHIVLFVMYFLVPLLYILRYATDVSSESNFHAISKSYRLRSDVKKSFVLLIKYFSLKAAPRVRCLSRTFGSEMIPVYCCMKNFGCATGGWTLAMKTDGSKVYSLH